jgi:DNA-binding transcriptional ArsR family regulator
MIEIFNQKFTKEILFLLYGAENGMYYGDIVSNFDAQRTNISRALGVLADNLLVVKEEIKEGRKNIPKSYYIITDLGVRTVELLKKDEELEKTKNKLITNQTNIKGRVGKVINVSGDNTTLNIK